MRNQITILARRLNRVAPVIVQAPMAGGITSPELVAAVSHAKGLGSFATGYLSTEQVRVGLRQIKEQTNEPFAVNLFIPNQVEVDEAQVLDYQKALNQFREALSLPTQDDVPENLIPHDNFAEVVDELILQEVPVVSFTFGNLPPWAIAAFQEKGTYLMGTATSLEEALALRESGIDAIVLQGTEAGGHRGSFFKEGGMPLSELVPLVAARIQDRPLIAAGGIMNGADINKTLKLGADGVQMGTAFLLTEESTAKEAYRQALDAMRGCQSDPTTLTKFYSGKSARGLETEFVREMRNMRFPNGLPPYPVINSLTGPIRKEAAKRGNQELMSLWAGQGISKLPEENIKAGALLERLRADINLALEERTAL